MEGGTEVCTVDGSVTGGFGVVEVFAFWAVEFDGLLARVVGLAHWQERLGVAEHTRAFAEVGFLVLVELPVVLAWYPNVWAAETGLYVPF